MPKLGRRLGEDERLTKRRLLSLIPEEAPGSRFNELVKTASAIGFSKPTLWRYLMRFEDLGIVIHEGRFYRRNPLYAFAAKSMAAKMSMSLISPTWQIAMGFDGHGHDSYEGSSLREDRHQDPWSLRKVTPKLGLKDPEKLYRWFEFHIADALSSYLTLLGVLCEAENLATARELANILMDSTVVEPLMELARDIWDHREERPLETLKGSKLNFKIVEGHPPLEMLKDPT